MKRGNTHRLSFIILILALILMPIILAAEPLDKLASSHDPIPEPELAASHIPEPGMAVSHSPQPPAANPWNETIIISKTWQTLIGTFFGLNLKDVSTKISVREALVFFSIFIMFLVLILDILKITPFFKTKILDIISGEFIAATIITILVSISGAFINLKDLFVSLVAKMIAWLNWSWVGLDLIIIILAFIVIWAFFDLLGPIIKKNSQLSRAKAQGRLLNTAVEKSKI